MFQEEYKKKYDQIHPSAELMERTKKLAMEKCKEQPEETELESYDPWNEDDSQFSRHKSWLRIAGAMAAGIAIVVSGVYLGNSLQPKSEKEQHVAKNVESTEMATICPEETSVVQKEKDHAAKNKHSKKKEKIQTNASSDIVAKLAQRTRGMVTIDYASANRVIFHGDFGIIIYSISERRVLENISSSQYACDGNAVNIEVNAEGNKILFYRNDVLDDDAKLYEVGSGQMKTVDPEDSVWQEEIFRNVQGVSGNDADVYVSRSGEMVVLGDGRYLQLMYQVPESSLMASLSVSIIDLNAKTEQLYSVFGETGKSMEKKQGREYGNYHNEHGIALFETVVEDEPDKEEGKETELPEQTEQPEETPHETAVVMETVEPLVEETEVPLEP